MGISRGRRRRRRRRRRLLWQALDSEERPATAGGSRADSIRPPVGPSGSSSAHGRGRRRGVACRPIRNGTLAPAQFLLAVVLLLLLFPGQRQPAAAERGPRELVHLRTATSESSVDDKGVYSTRFFAEPVHYRSGRRWERIVREFEQSDRQGYAWRSGANAFKAEFKDRAGNGLLRFEAGGSAFSLTLDGASPADGSKERANMLVYRNVFQQTDLSYALLADGLKETMVLRGAEAPAVYSFTLTEASGTDLRVSEREDGALVFTSADSPEPLFTFDPPVVSESTPDGKEAPPASGKVTLGARRLSPNSFSVTLRVDSEWLADPARLFPVYLDPSLTTSLAMQDGYWDTSAGTNPIQMTPTLLAGRNGSSNPIHKSAFVYDLASLPVGVTIVDAFVNVYLTGCLPNCSSADASLALHRLSSGFGAGTQWQFVQSDSAVVAAKQLTSPASGWYQLDNNGDDLRDAVAQMQGGQLDNFGFLLEKAGGTDSLFEFASSHDESDTSHAPTLEVHWRVDGVKLDPIERVRGNGAELFWQRFPASESAPYLRAVKSDSPAAYWRMDEAVGALGLVDDNGVYGGSYSTQGVTLAKQGAYVGSLSAGFDGSSGQALANAPAFGSGDFSLEAWFKVGTGGQGEIVVSADGTQKAELEIASDGKLTGYAIDDDAESVSLTPSAGTVTDDLWHHAVLVRAGSTFVLYLDGDPVAEAIDSPVDDLGDGPILTVAAENSGQRLNGQVDDVAFYTSALSAARVDAHFNAYSTTIPAFDRFEIHRSASPNFEPSDETLVATIKDQAIQSYRDTTAKPSTTFYYKVVTVFDGNTYASNELAALLPAAGQAKLTIQPGFSTSSVRGTYITSASQGDDNYGTQEVLLADATPSRALLAFDLRGVPNGAHVEQAKLELYTFRSSLATISIAAHRLLADWKELAATWHSNGYVEWTSAGGDFDPTAAATSGSGGPPHWDSWTLAPLVQAWVDGTNAPFGVLLKHPTETGAPSLSWVSENSPRALSLRPKLTVTYDDPAATVVAPTTSIASPGPGSQVKGTILVKAAADDDGRIDTVQFKLDGASLGSQDSTPPYEVSWNTGSADYGAHTLSVVATDDAGNVTTSAGTQVTVANSNAPTNVAVALDSYDTRVLADGPGGYWRLGETSGTNAADSAQGNTGTYTGGVTLGEDGVVKIAADNAVKLNGTTGTVSIPDNSDNSLDLGNSLTLEAWIKLTQLPAAERDVINKGADAYVLRLLADGRFALWKGGSGGGEIAKSPDPIPLNGYHHIAATKDGNTVHLYFDGDEVMPGIVNQFTLQNNGNALYLGSQNGASRYFSGWLDEAAVYDEALTDNEIAAHYDVAKASSVLVQTPEDPEDDEALSGVRFYAGSNLIGTDTSAPYSVTWNTLDAGNPAYDGTHILTAKAFDADGNITSSTDLTRIVANASDSEYQATISTTSPIPLELTEGEDGFPVTVSLTNNSPVSWPDATTKLRYLWIPAAGTAVESSDISIGGALSAGASRTLDPFTVIPPVVPNGVLRGRYTMRIDLVNTLGPTYFASQGNKPLETTVTVTAAEPTELGLERYQQYDGETLGGGFTNAVNLADGNNVITWQPFNQAGLGLNTVVNLTYNSLEQGSVSPLGNNWSLAISSLTPFGLPLDIHDDGTEHWVGFTDGDGSYHRFSGNSDDTYYTAPAGVHLYLRKAGTNWKLTKPDRTTFTFNEDGYPTKVTDKDNNSLTFGLEGVPADENPYRFDKRVTTVEDAGEREFTLAYYASNETGYPLVRGKLKSIGDHLDHKLLFDYYADGNLLRITEQGGTNADGSHLADRTVVLNYTKIDLTGPAIQSAQDRQNPPATTAQSPKLFSLIDFRGNETKFAYKSSGQFKGRLETRTPRAGDPTTFSYHTSPTRTTVEMPLNRDWDYTFDSSGRVTAIQDPLNTPSTTIDWTADNTVEKVTAPSGTSTEFAYNENGYRTDKWDQLGNHTTIEYDSFAVDTNDNAGNWEDGREIGHLSRVTTITRPAGTEAGVDDPQYAPLATMIGFVGETANGWLLANGAQRSRTDDEALFAEIGTTYGEPDSGHFNLPDLRGRMAVGRNTTNADVASLGNNEAADLADRGPKHNHTVAWTAGLPLSASPGGQTNRGDGSGRNLGSLSIGPQQDAPTDQPAYETINFLIQPSAEQTAFPVGAVLVYSGPAESVPAGWLLADGGDVSRTSTLGELLDDAYGHDNQNTYNLPDLQGRIPFGVNPAGSADVDQRGRNEDAPSQSRRPKHNHPATWVDTPPISDLGGQQTNLGSAPGVKRTHVAVGPQTAAPTDAPAYLSLHYIVKADQAAGIPLSAILPSASARAPTGYAIADGAATSRAGYEQLFELNGITYGSGDGTSTFNLPDLQGRAAVGVNPDNDDVNELAENEGASLAGRRPAHNHSLTWAGAPPGMVGKEAGADANRGDSVGIKLAALSVGPSDAPTDAPAYLTLTYLIHTSVNPNARSTRVTYTNNLHDRVATIIDAFDNAVTNSWNDDGTLASQTLPTNGDGMTRTTTYSDYDDSGLPTTITDGAGNVTRASYDSAGRLLSIQDALHSSFTGGDVRAYRTVIDYDAFGRPGRQSQPSSSSLRPGLLIWSSSSYDPNDNLTAAHGAAYGGGDGHNGAQTTSTFDSMDRPTLTTGPRSEAGGGPVKTTYEYDDAGRLKRVTAPKGVNTTPAQGHWVDDFVTENEYDTLDRTLSQTRYAVDANGDPDTNRTRTTYICYDLAGDPRSVTAPKGAASFDQTEGCPENDADPYPYTAATHTTKYSYDAAHQLLTTTRTINTQDRTTTVAYDADSHVVESIDEEGNVSTASFDDRGLKISETAPFDGARVLTTRYEYNPLGKLRSLISPRAHESAVDVPTDYVESYSYDALVRPTMTTLPATGSADAAYTHRAYDALGRQTMVSLPTTADDPADLGTAEKNTTRYWDAGQIYSSTDGATGLTIRYGYTAEGWQAERLPETTGLPGVSDYSRAMYWDYLPDGLLSQIRDLGGQRESFSYDANGNRTLALEASGLTSGEQKPLRIDQSFDDFDQPSKVRIPAAGTDYTVTRFAYDLDGNTTGLVDSALENAAGAETAPGRSYEYTFDVLDQPITQSDDHGTPTDLLDDEQVDYAYTGTGRLATRTLSKASSGPLVPEQTRVASYFENGLLKVLTNKNGAGDTIANHELNYTGIDGAYQNGNRVTDAFSLQGPNTACHTTCTAAWEYDARDRLTRETPATEQPATQYELDTIGNILRQASGGTIIDRTYTGQKLATQTIGDETTRYLYDAFGNLDCSIKSGTGDACTAPQVQLIEDYGYDYKDRLQTYRKYSSNGSLSDSTDYVNDAIDRPIQQTETHGTTTKRIDFSYTGASNALSREDHTPITGSSTDTTRTYSYDAFGQRLTLTDAITGGDTNRYSYLYDPHGSISLLIDQSNSVKASYGYTGYGNASSLTQAAGGFDMNINSYRYSGKRFDTGSNTYDMGARRYAPGIARFVQQDLYYGAFADLGLASDPLLGNRYLLAGANPVNFIEVDGHAFREDDGAGEDAPPPSRDPGSSGGGSDENGDDGPSDGDGEAEACSLKRCGSAADSVAESANRSWLNVGVADRVGPGISPGAVGGIGVVIGCIVLCHYPSPNYINWVSPDFETIISFSTKEPLSWDDAQKIGNPRERKKGRKPIRDAGGGEKVRQEVLEGLARNKGAKVERDPSSGKITRVDIPGRGTAYAYPSKDAKGQLSIQFGRSSTTRF